MEKDESSNEINSHETETDGNSCESFEVNEDSILDKNFDILDVIGKGAYAAAVYKVQSRLDDKLYAIKVIPCEKLNEEVLKEVKFLSELNHPNVVRYYSAWTDANMKNEDYDKYSENSDDSISFERESSDKKSNEKDFLCMYIQMEFCETTLRNAIDGILDRPLCLDGDKEQLSQYQNSYRILRLITHIVKGLAHIHGKGLIHRDLKPENILIDRNNYAKLGDFGLATRNNALANGKASHTAGVGTPNYDAPELTVCSGSKAHYNEKVDMYSLGIIIYEMYHPRFETNMERKSVLSDLRRNPVHIRPCAAPEGQLKLIRKLLDHDAKKRPSAPEILENEYLVMSQNIASSDTIVRLVRDETQILVRETNSLEAMKNIARKIFELHGGMCMSADFSSRALADERIINEGIHSKMYFFKSSNEARFDMVFPDSTSTNLAMTLEALEIAYEFIHSFSGCANTTDFVIRVTHRSIAEMVQTFKRTYESGYFLEFLRTDDMDIEEWEEIFLDDDFESGHIFSLIRRTAAHLDTAFGNLADFVDLLKSREMKFPVVIGSKLKKTQVSYSDIIFQIVSENEVVADGGHCRLHTNSSTSKNHTQQSVVGVTIFFNQFFNILEPKSISLSKFEVLICTVNSAALLNEQFDLAKKLIDVGICCRVSYHRNVQVIKRYVEKGMIHYAVLLEKSKLSGDHQVILYSRNCSNNFQEENIVMEKIVPHLKKTIEQSSLV